jgi:hypothetical protein
VSAPRADELSPVQPAGVSPARPARRTRSLRERLLLALVGVSVGSVLLAGTITVVSARRVDRAQALGELRTSLASLAAAEQAGEPFPTLVRLQRLLRLQGVGLVVVNDRGAVNTLGTGPLGRRLPGRPFDARNLDLDAIREAAAHVEPYLRVDGTKVWSLMQLERQLHPDAYGRVRGGYIARRRPRATGA